MKRCISCIIPYSFPGAKFDSAGECSICRRFRERDGLIPSLGKLRNRLDGIINENKGVNPKYDALVAYSGGKDSTFLVYTLKMKYGLNLLAFTFDNGFISGHAVSNIKTVLNKLDIDHIIFKPRYGLMAKIFAASADIPVYPVSLLKFGSAVCISCIRMVNNLALKTAVEKKIPMVMLGNSPGQLIQSENELIYRDNMIPYELKKSLFKPLSESIGSEIYDYFLLGEEQYKVKPFPYTVNPFPIIGYDEETIYRTIAKLGWQKPDDVDPNSTNCRLNSLGIIRHREKLNFHPYDYEMSMLVRLGIISREDALKRVEDPDGRVPVIAEQVAEKLNRAQFLNP